ncbi:hypothetical protein A2334_01790 [Candidatus Roizmanbacteria bacterium RIFOXYB2_FULL_38_10]|uniref:Uncharacterized protein n=1 Tax=Candidatus Roizmanbacteria bacterium RIFOXYD1_FULL_38_12 TaxID=1802093 RepID=A0A1F7L1Q5_9BACT|nr:MAG: hypothetical protein A3K47_04850 [Candidatus Roizmanbacteria bacterium RIFOXYA2_FULL_38_14]OGK64077.1 MAG: hypothetical protein A3K27_04850 [Candidatus Roizmanbacteria bacterium RIFOXYA1_FULL_37_12]OGK65923.1 MAG: hypothetical protein A3K38_04850 [Candidatus Roizmanbacteria bacterium RIFOXYB1_FULL_40_23]OGK68076.1 MAG: hypothetical protein A2334_01790 [Candidatus Roizmanbacteria bacterium RIFOXYB2_FULL_38_10]OGK70328.1 MAG: hypothetical protein A3K21_04855 [Candidatus Roizmanbacteria ba
MQKILLSKEQIFHLARENKYEVKEDGQYRSRCIDGRYGDTPNLPGLAIPGADAGELVLIIAASNEYGFELDKDKAYRTLVEIIGGENNLGFHTDIHTQKGNVFEGCGHMSQILLTPKDYGVTSEDLQFVTNTFTKAKIQGAKEQILREDHIEGAVVLVKGEYSIYPQYDALVEGHRKHTQVFVYHTDLVNKRHRLLAKSLYENKAVTLPQGCDDEYLYEVLSETGEAHLMETLKCLGAALPIYEVTFDKDGGVDLEEMGVV